MPANRPKSSPPHPPHLRLAAMGPVPKNPPKDNSPENSTYYVGRSRFNGVMERLKGNSFRHPPGYVPIYGPLTDMPAFNAGVLAAEDRAPIASCPFLTTKERESWLDAYAWRSATLVTITPLEMPANLRKAPARDAETGFGRGRKRGRAIAAGTMVA